MIELLIQKWYEPPTSGALHLSTLIQQLLSIIAQYGGVTALDAWKCLCKAGPFNNVSKGMFLNLLRNLGKNGILTQSSDETLLLDIKGERIVNHYSFYAALSTPPEEYRLFSKGKLLGTIPIIYPLTQGSFIIFAGQRWKVISVDAEKKTVELSLSKGGRPPIFSGGGCTVHNRVREEMWGVYTSLDTPLYLNGTGQGLLREGRRNFARYGLIDNPFLQSGKDTLIFVWKGDRVVNTIALMLKCKDLSVTQNGFLITVDDAAVEEVIAVLRSLSCNVIEKAHIAHSIMNKKIEKYDYLLDDDLLSSNYASSYLDIEGADSAINDLLSAVK